MKRGPIFSKIQKISRCGRSETNNLPKSPAPAEPEIGIAQFGNPEKIPGAKNGSLIGTTDPQTEEASSIGLVSGIILSLIILSVVAYVFLKSKRSKNNLPEHELDKIESDEKADEGKENENETIKTKEMPESTKRLLP